MKSNWHKALLASLLMIFSGLAGCLEADSIIEESSDDNDSEINSDTGNNSTSDTGNNTAGNVTVIPDYGTIMTSTYHVAQLVSAIVGPTATVEMMSTSNIPVHDYEPSLQDTVRLANSDVFFYHGLNLEPWVEGTLSTLGSDAPPAYATHTMPSGEVTPDYQSLLVSDLCAQLSEGDREFNNLIAYENLASQLEIHLEKGVQSLTFPSADAASLEGHDHSDDDHDDHDDHGDHDDHDDDDNHTDDDHGDHDDHDNHTDDDHGDHDDHDDHSGHDDHDDHGDHDGHAHAEPEKIIENPNGCPADTTIAVFHLEKGEHIVEFETNSTDITNFEVAALPMLGGHAHHHHDHGSHDGHDDHDDHSGHDDHDDHSGHDDHDDHGDHDNHDDHSGHGDEAFEWAGIFAMSDASHTWSMQKVNGAYADPSMRLVLIPTDTPDEATLHSLEGGVEALIEGDCTVVEDGETMQNIADTGTCFELHVGTGDDSTFNMDTTGLSGLAIYAQHVPTEFERDQHYLKDSTGADIEPVAQEGGGDHGHHGHGDHDEHEEYPICHNVETHENMEGTNQSDCEDAGNLWMEGAPNDGTRGYLTIHVENEGDYGFALPSHITAHILMGEGSHDDHDDHSGHDDHDDHDGHDDHDDHGDESTIVSDDDEEEFEYDPHSWLDPVAFKAQTELVLNALIEQFPEGSDTFTANAQEFMLELDRIHIGYTNAFGESSTCTTNTVAANHNAYSYLTVRYGIEFVTVHGLDPEGEPSVADIAEVIEKINEDEINVLYIEEYTQRSAVDSIVEATNVEVLYLYTMEMSPTDSSDTYLTMMNKNLENLKTGMGCTA